MKSMDELLYQGANRFDVSYQERVKARTRLKKRQSSNKIVSFEKEKESYSF